MPKKADKKELKNKVAVKKAAKVKVVKKKIVRKKPKPADNHVKSFYRPKSPQIRIIHTETETDMKVDNMILIPVAIVLAITSIGLHLMMAIAFTSNR
jgi:hypothetical protein